MAGRPVLLILGAGPRVGTSVADSFAASGYNVAVVSRKGTKSEATKGYLSLQADFSKPESVPALFDAVTKQYKEAPSVVVYNAAAMTPPPADGTLAIPAEKVASDLNVNTVSPYVAAQEAVKGWQTLLKEAKKTFIYTGNALNNLVLPVPMMVNLGVGKAASACWIGVADETYSTQGYRQVFRDASCSERC